MIVVETMTPGFVQIEYGPTNAYGTVASGHHAGHTSLTRHMQQIAGLQPGTPYHFRVRTSDSMDMANPLLSADQTFTTFTGDSGDCGGRTNVAFCDTFDVAHPGGRGGDLNESRWSFSRAGSDSNPNGGVLFRWLPVDVQFCRDTKRDVLPDADSFFCGTEFNESHHWMEAFTDTGYTYNSARIKQVFDFTGRTGTVFFDLDAKVTQGHGWWPEFFLTDEPTNLPHNHVMSLYPRNALHINLGRTCGQMVGPGTIMNGGGVGYIAHIRNHALVQDNIQPNEADCIATATDAPNRFEIRVNTNRVEVWASDASPDHAVTIPRFRKIASLDNINLPFSKGYVHFQHAEYSAAKDGNGPTTYHWDNMGFDGPKHPLNRSYEVPNSLTRLPSGEGVNIGYWVNPAGGMDDGEKPVAPFILRNVNTAGAREAFLMATYSGYNDVPVQYRFNGGAWRTAANGEGYGGFAAPVPLGDLRNGDNTLEFRRAEGLVIANIELELLLAGGATPPARTADLNNDGVVDVADLSILLNAWGSNDAVADIDASGTVEVADLSLLLAHWG